MDRTRQDVTSIETLEEILELLRITEEDALEETRTTDIVSSNMLRVQILAALVIVTSKSMVSDLGYFDEDWTKFEDW